MFLPDLAHICSAFCCLQDVSKAVSQSILRAAQGVSKRPSRALVTKKGRGVGTYPESPGEAEAGLTADHIPDS